MTTPDTRDRHCTCGWVAIDAKLDSLGAQRIVQPLICPLHDDEGRPRQRRN